MSGDLYAQYRRAYRTAGRGVHFGRRGSKAIAVLAAVVMFAGGSGASAAIIVHHHHHSGPGCAAPSGNVALGQCLAGGYGWTGQQWTCLDALWNRESGWSATATNPQSGAYGVAQSLHGSQGGTGGDEYSASDPEGLTGPQLAAANDGDAYQQIRWGLGYIANTYETPCQAWAHEETDGWY